MSSKFRSRYISGDGAQADTCDELIRESYDVMLLTSSWDKRSVLLSASRALEAKCGILLLFENKGTSGLRDTHDQVLLEFVNSSCGSRQVVEGASEDLETIWGELLVAVQETYKWLGRPLRMLVDLSSCPRYYALALLGVCMSDGLVGELHYFYAEGEYPGVVEEAATAEVFTVGRWSTVPVPGFQGEYRPALGRAYTVSVGFEGAKIFRTLLRADPERIVLLLPRPGTRPEYEDMSWDACRAVRDEFGIGEADILEAPAGDAIAAWQRLTIAGEESGHIANWSYLCAGTKPHSLALALRALATGQGALLYNLPTSHRETQVRPSGKVWLFAIQDLSSVG